MIILSDELDGIGKDLWFFAISLYKNAMPDGKLQQRPEQVRHILPGGLPAHECADSGWLEKAGKSLMPRQNLRKL